MTTETISLQITKENTYINGLENTLGCAGRRGDGIVSCNNLRVKKNCAMRTRGLGIAINSQWRSSFISKFGAKTDKDWVCKISNFKQPPQEL